MHGGWQLLHKLANSTWVEIIYVRNSGQITWDKVYEETCCRENAAINSAPKYIAFLKWHVAWCMVGGDKLAT